MGYRMNTLLHRKDSGTNKNIQNTPAKYKMLLERVREINEMIIFFSFFKYFTIF